MHAKHDVVRKVARIDFPRVPRLVGSKTTQKRQATAQVSVSWMLTQKFRTCALAMCFLVVLEPTNRGIPGKSILAF